MPTAKLGLGIRATRGGAAFSPAKFDNLVIWTDPSDVATITESGGAVSAIADKSGRGNNGTQSDAARRPTTGTQTLNGLNVLRSQLDFLIYADNADIQEDEFTFLLLCADNSVGTTYRPYITKYGAGGTRSYNYNCLDATNLTNLTYSYTTIAPTPGTTFTTLNRREQAFSNGAARIIGIRKTPSTGLLEQIYSGTINQAAIDGRELFKSAAPIRIGFDGASTYAADMFIGEFLYYNRALTNAELDRLGTYLANKWGAPWATEAETLITSGASQSNDTLPFTVGGGYDEEGLTAFNAEAPTYGYKRYEALNTSTSGYMLRVANSSPPTSYGYVENDGTAGPAFDSYYQSNLESTVNGKSTWGDKSKVKFVRMHGCEGDVTDSKADIKTAMGDLMDLLVTEHGADVVLTAHVSPTYALSVTDAEWQALKEARIEAVEEHANGIARQYQFETYHRALADGQHFSAAANTLIWEDWTQLWAALDGRGSHIVEPNVISATWSGDEIVINTDAGSLTGTEFGIFRVEDDGVAATISSMNITGGQITLTLSASIAGGSVVKLWVNYGKGDTWTLANIPVDANGRPIKTIYDYTVTAS